jgi:hypothetical protein
MFHNPADGPVDDPILTEFLFSTVLVMNLLMITTVTDALFEPTARKRK